jgi:soluble lytic murein transglycosylase-like protein
MRPGWRKGHRCPSRQPLKPDARAADGPASARYRSEPPLTKFRFTRGGGRRKLSKGARRVLVRSSVVVGAIALAATAYAALRAVDLAPYDRAISLAANESNVDPVLIRAVIAVESKGDPDARSPVGAQGLMQLMPDTATWTANRLSPGWTDPDVWHPRTNIRLGTAYLRYCLDESALSPEWAAACYHGGPARVRRLREAAGSPIDPIPVLEAAKMPNTAHYVRKIRAAMLEYGTP